MELGNILWPQRMTRHWIIRPPITFLIVRVPRKGIGGFRANLVMSNYKT